MTMTYISWKLSPIFVLNGILVGNYPDPTGGILKSIITFNIVVSVYFYVYGTLKNERHLGVVRTLLILLCLPLVLLVSSLLENAGIVYSWFGKPNEFYVVKKVSMARDEDV